VQFGTIVSMLLVFLNHCFARGKQKTTIDLCMDGHHSWLPDFSTQNMHYFWAWNLFKNCFTMEEIQKI